MKINLKVRLKNPVFWLTIIPAIAACVYTILGLFGIVPTVTEDYLVNVLSAIVTVLTMLGVLVDPTTSGVTDSDQAMEYIVPKSDKGKVDENDINK